MSRGFSITVELLLSEGSQLVYEVKAYGWIQPSQEEVVGYLSIDRDQAKVRFEGEGSWANEPFYIPAYETLLKPIDVEFSFERANKNYGWWNVRLISIIHELVSSNKIEDGFRCYQ